LQFNLDEMNQLTFYDATETPSLRARRPINVTGPDHPYWQNFWKPAHPIGYEHTFIATLGDFLTALAKKAEFHADFDDGVEVQRVLQTVENSAASGTWLQIQATNKA
jgi:hypothetical protein